MNGAQKNRILIAALKSGSGKTIFTCALLMLLKERFQQPAIPMSEQMPGALSAMPEQGNHGRSSVTAYKCGPDYIDPMFHKKVLEIDGTNLDPFFSDREELRGILAEDQAAISVIEGAMGIYDGISGMGRTGSCYDVAVKTGTPILLVADASGMGATICSVLKGILLDDKEACISGIVFNRMSDAYLDLLRPELSAMLSEIGRDVRILGAIPKSKHICFESRHLGLMMPEEVDGVLKQIRSYANLIEAHINLEGLVEIAGRAEPLETQVSVRPARNVKDSMAPSLQSQANTGHKEQNTDADSAPLVLGVAKDEAFCFYYERNLKMFEERGVQIRTFSPISDEKLPENLDGLLLGGGYPELYLRQLSENESLKSDIRQAIASGMPSLAECGGFMYLGEYIEEDGVRYPMAGVITGGAVNKGRLTRFGYVTVTPEKNGLLKGPIRAHEFHYYDTENNGADCLASKPGSKRSWNCIHMGEQHFWGYPHLYYPSNPAFVDAFVDQMQKFSKKRQ